MQVHAWRRHQDEYDSILPHIASIVTAPLLIGDDLRNPGCIELLGRVPTIAGYILVAICVEATVPGKYEVRSFFSTKEDKVQRRKERGFLFNAPIG